MAPHIFPESDWDMLGELAADIQRFMGWPDLDSDYTELWRRGMGYADYRSAGRPEIREWFSDCMYDMAPAFFNNMQEYERAESLGPIPYTPPAE